MAPGNGGASGGVDRIVDGKGAVILRPVWKHPIPGFTAAVSTRIGGVSAGTLGLNTSFRVGDDEGKVRRNRELFFTAAGIDRTRVATAGQVHGAVVAKVSGPGHFERSDALVTSVPGLYLAVSIADCLPIILVDPTRRACGVVHSGWKGSVGKIAQRALEAMAEHFGTTPADVHAYIGPCAGGCCYEVGEDVASLFPEDVLLEGSGPRKTGSGSARGGVRLDLGAFNRAVLLRAGVPEAQIGVSTHCTIHEAELFHSHRRDAAASGRMMVVAGFGQNVQNLKGSAAKG